MTARRLIVVPTYNESGNIQELIDRIFASLPDVHLVVVDDDSPDGTAELVEKIRASHPTLQLIRRKGERGYGRALTAGIHFGLDGGFDVIGTMDADLSHDPAYLFPMI